MENISASFAVKKNLQYLRKNILMRLLWSDL